jgi:glyoxylate carboligase
VNYLVAYLKKIGVSHLFGIPGDLVINLFLKFGRPKGLKIIALAHEPGVGFGADGSARSTGRIGIICVSYGAGEHNMVNPLPAPFRASADSRHQWRAGAGKVTKSRLLRNFAAPCKRPLDPVNLPSSRCR